MKSLDKAMHWSRRNLFSSLSDSVLSTACIVGCLWLFFKIITWAMQMADWTVITDNLRVFMVGTYPNTMMNRPWISTAILALLSGISMGLVAGKSNKLTICGAMMAVSLSIAAYLKNDSALMMACICFAISFVAWRCATTWKFVRRYTMLAWIVGIVTIVIILFPSGVEKWGGLMMSVLFTLLSAFLSVPLGVLLAFGRRSRYPSARILCSAYIEVMRSLPLILVVYCIWIIFPLLMPDNPGPDLLRGMIGFTLFYAAYVAEYVRSGLQSIPKGQIEAANSLGMSNWQVGREIVLPQAIRVVMPALVGNVLDVFNTVPLLFIIGMTDFLRAGQMVLVNPQSGNRTYEIYAFMFAVYLMVSSLITYGARKLERKMAVGRH